MNISHIQMLAISVLAGASSGLAPAPTNAKVGTLESSAPALSLQNRQANNVPMPRSRRATRRPAATTPICALDKETGVGLTILKVPAMASAILVEGMPHRFSLVEEEVCADQRDNDCDGNIDEDCSRCGDGRVDANEQCDDANTQDGDGCSARCTYEEPVCGNGIVEQGEECDDGNNNSADGCAYCGRGPICGNAFLEPPYEECDDGNFEAGDGCSPDCRLEEAVCGNGIVEKGEDCDPGGINSYSSVRCSDDCQFEPDGPHFHPHSCDNCMAEKCGEQVEACVNEKDCPASGRCLVEKGCMTRKLGPLSCLCGENRTVAECMSTKLEDLDGECKAELAKGLGVNSTEHAIARFLSTDTPTGLVNGVYVCMARKCASPCERAFPQ